MTRRGRHGLSKGLSEADHALWQRLTANVRPLPNRPAPPEIGPTRLRRGIREQAPELPWRPLATGQRGGPPGPIDPNRLRRLGRGHEEVDSLIDLHGMTAAEAHLGLARHVAAAAARGERLVLAITGKGGTRFAQTAALPAAFRRRADFGEDGVLRRMLPLWLEGPDLAPLVAGYSRAHRRHGGDGAFYILLRRRRG